ncbi:argininosuccinate synthase [Monoraphidium neglectum]|uniref:Argininosuccinate synthase n=1 Tax=Monoraphidium neglectum TaxID=145388 RepID=A0A0D2LXA1_9CHLO|nr:argininosuccinate synthase [Monoraphidium neglectum]KIY94121.1 argininosuccinate synthase [Monoraphidium neglectum]|eukprot:XP_013893141.1 argininosuccinate synthase [Monoraphidium neglectum]
MALAGAKSSAFAGSALSRAPAGLPRPVVSRAAARSLRVRAQSAPGGKIKVKKVVLAYSGGLDTSVILKWLQDEYNCEVVTFTADLGQGEELEPARAKAEQMGVKSIFIDDLREEFVKDYVFPMFRANAQYEGIYLLGTSIARPLIAKRQIEIAKEHRGRGRAPGAGGGGGGGSRGEGPSGRGSGARRRGSVGADAVCHGATGKGNDQQNKQSPTPATCHLDPDPAPRVM